MQIKNKIFLIITLFLSTILFTQTINADEFDISATEILIDKDKDILTGIGSVEAIDSEGKIIKADNKKFYSWVDIGSEYRASELSSALLYSQMLKVKKIQKRREIIWKKFDKIIENLKTKKFYLIKPLIGSTSAYHLFVLIFRNKKLSAQFKSKMQKNNIAATFHYIPLHKSKMGKKYHKIKLPITENIFSQVVRLPLFSDMTKNEFNKIIKIIKEFTNE